VPGLKVSARTSAFSFKGKGVAIPEIARQLGVAYVVEGSVRKAGNRVRITAQLIKAADGFHVWSDNFDRELKDIFAVQDEIAGLVARRLSVSFGVTASPSAKPINPEAYQLYLQSRQAWNITDAGNAEAEQLLERALALEPNFAKAHAALSDVWRYRVQGDFSSATYTQRDGPGTRRLVDAAQRAVNLDPELAEGWAALGAAHWMSWRFDDAERELRQAAALNPNYAVGRQLYGRVLMAVGKPSAGLAELRRAVELDPLSSRIADNCSVALLSAGQFEESLAYADRALTLEPANDQALGLKAEALANLGRREEGRRWREL
jgi:adenylate cyclase